MAGPRGPSNSLPMRARVSRQSRAASALFCVVVGDHVGLSTHDGGATWGVESTLASDLFRDVDCMNSTTCLAVSWADAVWTDTAGSSWSTTPGAGGSAMACSTTSCAVFPVGPTATGYVWVPPPGSPTVSTLPSNLGRFEHASCAGATCLSIGSATPGSPAIPLSVAGVSLSNAAILRTIDAGVTWGRVASPPPAESFNDLDCVSASICVVVGDSGTVSPTLAREGSMRRTADGGTAWSPVASSEPARSTEQRGMPIQRALRRTRVLLGELGAVERNLDGLGCDLVPCTAVAGLRRSELRRHPGEHVRHHVSGFGRLLRDGRSPRPRRPPP